MAEFEFIDWLKAELTAQHAPNRALPIPPGDDCAEVPAGGGTALFAADMLMDGVHFDLKKNSPELAGRKALAVNLSDIAAMAGVPTSVTVCLALPRRAGMEVAAAVSRGIMTLAKDFGVAVAGGDTNSWDGPLVISVAILGEVGPKGPVTRGGARPGDWVFVTGALGGTIDGKHLTFIPRVKEALQLHGRYGLTSMIDLSDGLGSDLRHILRASGVGARLTKSAIPVAAAAPDFANALSGGEDFELCFTLPAAAGARLMREQPFGSSLPVTHIGEITAGPELTWEDGTEVVETGWRHALD